MKKDCMHLIWEEIEDEDGDKVMICYDCKKTRWELEQKEFIKKNTKLNQF